LQRKYYLQLMEIRESNKRHYTGLTDEQVIDSRKQYGENQLTPPKKESLWLQFFEKLSDPIIIILLIALLLSIGVSCFEFFSGHGTVGVFFEPAGILIAILLATVVGFGFEVNANKKFEILNQVNDDIQVKVIRNGNICQILRKEVVVGDIILFETGEEIPLTPSHWQGNYGQSYEESKIPLLTTFEGIPEGFVKITLPQLPPKKSAKSKNKETLDLFSETDFLSNPDK